jgi:TolA-binding protein
VENAEFVASAGTQELRELRGDIDARLKNLEQKLNEATNIPETKEGLWQEADALSKRKNHAGARRLLRLYEGRYPDDVRLPDVRFQIGLTYFSERDYKSALGEFYRVVQDAPAAPIVPDALYYSGLAFAKLGQCQNAIAYFQALSKPKANAADRYKQKAQEQIQALQADRGQICTDRDDANAGAAAGQGIGEAAKPPTAAAPK